jgi:hypothetical protein
MLESRSSMKLVPLTLVATVVLMGSVVASAGAAGIDVCTLVTKKEASKILGSKVVKIKRETNASTGDQECEYRTKVYVSPRFRKLKAPLKLQVTLGTLTADLRREIDDNQSELDPYTDLGNEAYFTGTTRTDLLVVAGEYLLQTGPANWEGGPSKYQAMAEAAARTALARIPTG